MANENNLEELVINAQRHIDTYAKGQEWMTIDEAQNAWIEAASMLFENEKIK